MKTIRIALPFVSEVRPLLDNQELKDEPGGDIDFCKLHKLVQEYIVKQIQFNEYHEAVCERFTEYLEREFNTFIPSARLKYIGFDEFDVWTDFSFEEQEFAKVCREHETALQKLLTDLNGSLNNNTELDDYTEILHYLIEQEHAGNFSIGTTIANDIPMNEYIDLSCFEELATQTFELERHANWEKAFAKKFSMKELRAFLEDIDYGDGWRSLDAARPNGGCYNLNEDYSCVITRADYNDCVKFVRYMRDNFGEYAEGILKEIEEDSKFFNNGVER